MRRTKSAVYEKGMEEKTEKNAMTRREIIPFSSLVPVILSASLASVVWCVIGWWGGVLVGHTISLSTPVCMVTSVIWCYGVDHRRIDISRHK